jgi:protease I
LSGGKAPQKLREDKKVLNFVHNFINTNKTIAAICHGSQILISANVVKGKKIAATKEVKSELEKVGAIFADEALQEDGQFITARKLGDLHRHLYGVLKYLKQE